MYGHVILGSRRAGKETWKRERGITSTRMSNRAGHSSGKLDALVSPIGPSPRIASLEEEESISSSFPILTWPNIAGWSLYIHIAHAFTDKIWVRKWEGWGTLRLFLCQIGLSIWGTASMIIRNRRLRGVFCFLLNTCGFWSCFKYFKIKTRSLLTKLSGCIPCHTALCKCTPATSTFQILTMPIV